MIHLHTLGNVSFIYKRKEEGQRQTEREEWGGGMGRKKKEKRVKPEVCWYYLCFIHLHTGDCYIHLTKGEMGINRHRGNL